MLTIRTAAERNGEATYRTSLTLRLSCPCLICGSTCDRFTITTSFCVLLLQVFLVFSVGVFRGSLCVTLALWEKSLGFSSCCIIDAWRLKPDWEVCVCTAWFHLHSSWMSCQLRALIKTSADLVYCTLCLKVKCVIYMPLVLSNGFAKIIVFKQVSQVLLVLFGWTVPIPNSLVESELLFG